MIFFLRRHTIRVKRVRGGFWLRGGLGFVVMCLSVCELELKNKADQAQMRFESLRVLTIAVDMYATCTQDIWTDRMKIE